MLTILGLLVCLLVVIRVFQKAIVKPKGDLFMKWLRGNRLFVGWLLNVPIICQCILGTDQLRQFYVLPHLHWDRSCRPNFLSHPVTVYWHWANQSQRSSQTTGCQNSEKVEGGGCNWWNHLFVGAWWHCRTSTAWQIGTRQWWLQTF